MSLVVRSLVVTPLDMRAYWHDTYPACAPIAKHELEDDEDPNFWHLYMSEWVWAPGVFNPILRLIAVDAIADTMIIGMKNEWIYHPHDGGADVVLSDTIGRTRLNKKFERWLSHHPLGL